MKVSTVTEAIQADSATLAKIRKESGEIVTKALVVRIVSDLIVFFSVGKGMNDFQLAETSRLILQEFYHLKLEDLKIFSDYVKSGKYGAAYDRVDGNTIMVALRQYDKERAEISEGIRLQEREVRKSEELQELFYLELNGEYIRKLDDGFALVADAEFATKFTLSESYLVKKKDTVTGHQIKIMAAHALERRLQYAERAKEIDKQLEQKQSDMAKENRSKYVAHKTTHTQKIKDIQNSGLTELEKTNAIRELTGLAALSEAEFNYRKEKSLL